jgi:Fimbrial assembly protein (PilN)
MQQSSVADKRAALDSVQARIKVLTEAGSGAEGQASLVNETSQRNAALVEVLGKTMAWDVALGNLARVIPSDVWLTGLTAQSPTPSGTPTVAGAAPTGASPTAFTLAGVARSHDAVAHLVARLQLLPMLKDVTLGDVTLGASAVPGAAQPAATSTSGAGAGAVDKLRPTLQFHLTASVQPTPKGAAS